MRFCNLSLTLRFKDIRLLNFYMLDIASKLLFPESQNTIERENEEYKGILEPSSGVKGYFDLEKLKDWTSFLTRTKRNGKMGAMRSKRLSCSLLTVQRARIVGSPQTLLGFYVS